MSNVYDDVAELQTQVAALQSQVATLPEGCRPERVYHFLQNKTASGGVPMVARWKIESNGRIIMVFAENQSEATHWFALDTTFLIN